MTFHAAFKEKIVFYKQHNTSGIAADIPQHTNGMGGVGVESLSAYADGQSRQGSPDRNPAHVGEGMPKKRHIKEYDPD
ncbi:MAG: hypothetical protein AAF934_12085 [Bacteroidota bacterium]